MMNTKYFYYQQYLQNYRREMIFLVLLFFQKDIEFFFMFIELNNLSEYMIK